MTMRELMLAGLLLLGMTVSAFAVPYGGSGSLSSADAPYQGPSPYILSASQMGSSLVAFEEADNDASRSVNLAEFVKFQREQSGLSPASAAHQFRRLDADGNGLLSRDEFPSVKR